MIIIDENHNIIINPDLSKGHLVPCTIIDPNASSIDNVNKFAWADEDYIQAQMYILNKSEPEINPDDQYVTFGDLNKALSKGVNSI